MSQPTEPTTPRPLTPAARRQSWRELPVRVWTLITLGVAVVIFAVGVRAIAQGIADRKLLQNGVQVDARLDRIGGASRNVDRAVAHEVDLSFLLPGETERRELNKVILPASGDGGTMDKGDTMPLLVDPKDIRTWTARVHPASWLVVLAVPLLLLPLAAVLILITLWRRSRVEKLFQTGSQRTANVIDAHRSALIPGQKIVKFSIGGRVLAAAFPDALGPIERGHGIDVIVNDEAKPTHGLVSRAYHSVSLDQG